MLLLWMLWGIWCKCSDREILSFPQSRELGSAGPCPAHDFTPPSTGPIRRISLSGRGGCDGRGHTEPARPVGPNGLVGGGRTSPARYTARPRISGGAGVGSGSPACCYEKVVGILRDNNYHHHIITRVPDMGETVSRLSDRVRTDLQKVEQAQAILGHKQPPEASAVMAMANPVLVAQRASPSQPGVLMKKNQNGRGCQPVSGLFARDEVLPPLLEDQQAPLQTARPNPTMGMSEFAVKKIDTAKLKRQEHPAHLATSRISSRPSQIFAAPSKTKRGGSIMEKIGSNQVAIRLPSSGRTIRLTIEGDEEMV
ncbi:hypothetical protein SS50377_20720 [Spironucleus salmonicida]|uniref:Uncharacterized protein n=1 Tax=Spironucleus salmonicida TaxID=348837 RepID=A0A9P8LZM6_9EUKA|nr:hypothetical protein SS50377_20720 [Spironucleus salmonicida]